MTEHPQLGSGPFSHPERAFILDLDAEEAMRDFFDELICYPTPSEGP